MSLSAFLLYNLVPEMTCNVLSGTLSLYYYYYSYYHPRVRLAMCSVAFVCVSVCPVNF